MNRLHLKKNVIGIIVISFVLALSAVLFTVIVSVKTEDFYQSASEVDYNISSGFFSQAENELSKLYDKINNKDTALGFLKRAERLASATGNYRDLAVYAKDLSSRYRNKIEITAIYAYAQYKNGNYADSITASREKLGRSEYNSIFLAASLKDNLTISDKKLLEKIPEKYRLFFEDKLPNAEELVSLSGTIPDSRLLTDAALLLMKEGEDDRALDIIKTLKPSNARLGMFIAYDNENYSLAAQYFSTLFAEKELAPDIQMFGADIFINIGNTEAAASIYNDIISKLPDFSWLPYRNLYSIESGSRNNIKYLENGLVFFPEKEELLLPLAWETYIKSGGTGDDRFAPLLNSDDNGALSELFRINVTLSNRSPEHIIGNYWNIFNREPESEIIAVAFANYLLRNRSFDQLDILIKKFASINGESSWTLMYQAVAACMRGNAGFADLMIDQAIEKSESSAVFFNKAVISSFEGKNSSAISWLERAALIAEADNNEKELAKIYYKSAEIYYNQTEYLKADKYVNQSLRIDPDDIRSSLLRKKIEEGYND